jgi:hypothetical protein
MLYVTLSPSFWTSHASRHSGARSKAKAELDVLFAPFHFWVDWARLKNERLPRVGQVVSPLTVEDWCRLIAYLSPYQGVSFGASLAPAPVIDLLSGLNPQFAEDLGLKPPRTFDVDRLEFERTDWLFESWHSARIRLRFPEPSIGEEYGAGTLRRIGGSTFFTCMRRTPLS